MLTILQQSQGCTKIARAFVAGEVVAEVFMFFETRHILTNRRAFKALEGVFISQVLLEFIKTLKFLLAVATSKDMQ
jgi:hypothetical protein